MSSLGKKLEKTRFLTLSTVNGTHLDVVFDVEAVVATDRALISLIMGALFDRFKLPGLSISIF